MGVDVNSPRIAVSVIGLGCRVLKQVYYGKDVSTRQFSFEKRRAALQQYRDTVSRSRAEYGSLDRRIHVAVMIAAGVLASIQIYVSLGSLQLMLDIGHLIGTPIGYITFLYFARTTL